MNDLSYSKEIRAAADRQSGRAVVRPTGTNPEKPDYVCAEYDAMYHDVAFVRAVFGGTKGMRQAGKALLPKHPLESESAYRDRSDISVSYNQLKRAIGGLTGMVFRRDPVIEGGTTVVLEDFDNIDRQGSDFPTFAKRIGEHAMRDGLTWAHVEAPPEPEGGFMSSAHKNESGFRPYWVHIPFEDAINWRYTFVDGKPELTLFVYKEYRTAEDGAFGSKSEVVYRVLTPGAFEVWQEVESGEGNDRKRAWEVIEEGTTSLDYIPVVPFFGRRGDDGPFSAEPPLLDVAYLNVEHYQIHSDYRHALSFASQAVPWVSGHDPDGKLAWGSGQMLVIPGERAQVGVMESSGVALQGSLDAEKAVEGRIAALSLSMMVRQTNPGTQDETATASLIDKAEGDSELSKFARGLQSSFNQAMRMHGDYRGIEAPWVTINKDFSALIIDANLASVLSQMVSQGQLSEITLWEILKTFEVLPEDFDPEEEQVRIAATVRTQLEPFMQNQNEVREAA